MLLNGNLTMSFKISDKQLLKKYNQICKRVEKLLKIESDSEPIYGDNDKYIKKNKNICWQYDYKFSEEKNCQKKKHHASVYQ